MKVLLARPPHPHLALHIKVLWVMAAPAEGSTLLRLPMNRSHLTWPLPGGACLVQSAPPDQPPSIIDGPLVSGFETRTRSITGLSPTPHVLVGAEFTPGGLQAFVDQPMGSWHDSLLPLNQLWPDTFVNSATQRLLSAMAVSLTETLSTLEYLLTLRLRPEAHQALPAQRALMTLLGSGPDMSVSDAAQRSGMSERQFREVVRRGTGLTPKVHARLLRFGKALSGLHHDKTPTDTALAADCGYFDQAHFIHEFKSLSGLTPTDYRRDHGHDEHSACVLSRTNKSWQQWLQSQQQQQQAALTTLALERRPLPR
jgi:AraC-like DNA-binding protein